MMTARRERTIGLVVERAAVEAARNGRVRARRCAARALRRLRAAQTPGLDPDRRRALLYESEVSALSVLAGLPAA